MKPLIINCCSSCAGQPAVSVFLSYVRTRKFKYEENGRAHNGCPKTRKNKH
ncbi:hypothetical protein BAIN110137_11420 [Bacillus inaquosorum]